MLIIDLANLSRTKMSTIQGRRGERESRRYCAGEGGGAKHSMMSEQMCNITTKVWQMILGGWYRKS